MSDFIWHNPRCSKSRQTLALIEQAGKDIDIVEYLKAPPKADELKAACAGQFDYSSQRSCICGARIVPKRSAQQR